MLRKVLKDEEYSYFGISSLIFQRNYNIRLDTWVLPEMKNECMRIIQKMFPKAYIREHIPFVRRNKNNYKNRKFDPSQSLNILSWNVKSIRNMR
jgi:exonuclease III